MTITYYHLLWIITKTRKKKRNRKNPKQKWCKNLKIYYIKVETDEMREAILTCVFRTIWAIIAKSSSSSQSQEELHWGQYSVC